MAFDVFTALEFVASYAAEQNRQNEVDAKFNDIVNNLQALRDAITDIGDVIREAIADNEISAALGDIEYARRKYKDGNFQLAAEKCEAVTSRLQQDDLRLQGAAAHELAASLHIASLQRAGALADMRDRCGLYAGHLTGVVDSMRNKVAQRITTGLEVDFSGIRWIYRIDGNVVEERSSQTDFANRRVFDTERLSATFTIPFACAAEDWRAVAAGRSADYGEILDGPKTGLPSIPGPLVVAHGKPASIGYPEIDGQQNRLSTYRILFDRSDVANLFSNYSVGVAEHIYDNGIARFYNLRYGTRIYTCPGKPSLVLLSKTTDESQLLVLPFASRSLGGELDAVFTQLSVHEWNEKFSEIGRGVHLKSLDKILE